MKTLVLDLPTFAFIVATRAMIGAGLGLLLAERLPSARRRALGGVLAAIGIAATVPAAIALLRGTNEGDRLHDRFTERSIDVNLPEVEMVESS